MNPNSVVQEQIEMPALRIAFRNQELLEPQSLSSKKGRKSRADKKAVVKKEPLPMFDDYKFKAKDYDPL